MRSIIHRLENQILAVLFFLLLSLIVVFSWFRYGMIYGGGDVGLQTYNPQRFVENAKFIWWEADAPGFPIPQGLTSVPLQFFLSLLQSAGFSPLMMQASLFFLVLFLMGYGMYLFSIFVLVEEKKSYAIFTGVFYMFNPYMMIQVWHRFIHNAFVLVAILPFITLSWMLWIKKGRFSYLLIFCLINLVAVYLYGTIAFIVTVWIFLFLITLFESTFPLKSKKDLLKAGWLFLIGLTFWILINLWWLIPTFTVGPALFSKQHSTEESVVTLINISRQAILPYSLQMINPFYLFYQQELGSLYQNVLVRLLPWLFVGIILTGLLIGLKQKRIVKWSIIFIVTLFLAKGASSPFGAVFVRGFENFFPLGVLRNPFEKAGIFLPFISSILFITGIKFFSDYLRKKIGVLSVYIFFLTIIISIIVFHWPMLAGQIFGRVDKLAFVKVPESYTKVDSWIKDDYAKYVYSQPGKILHLPLTTSEAISYNWEYGYNGLEPSSLFFTSLPSISHGFNIKYIDDALKALSQGFQDPSFDSDTLLNIVQSFNVRYIVLHKDIIWADVGIDNPLKIENVLNQLGFLSKSFQEGDLAVYKIDEQYFKNRIFVTDKVDLISGTNFKNPLLPYILKSNGDSVSFLDNQFDKSLNNRLTLIFPTEDFTYRIIPAFLADNVINQIYQNDSLLNQWLEPLAKTKVILRQNGEYPAEQLNDLIVRSTKNVLIMLRTGQGKKYTQDLEGILESNLSGSRLRSYIRSEDLSTVFQIHLKILKLISANTKDSQASNLYEKLSGKLISEKLLPRYQDTEGNAIEERRVFQFNVPVGGNYDIIIYTQDLEDAIDGQLFYINGKKEQISLRQLNKGISIYKQEFKEGNYEIQLPVSLSKNLFDNLDVVMFNADEGTKGETTEMVEFVRNNPISYRGKFSISTPSFLIFSESYNPGWKLVLKNVTGSFENKHYIANLYGNGWFIQEPGSYEFILEFTPQMWVKIGIIIAGLSYLIVIGVAFVQKKYE